MKAPRTRFNGEIGDVIIVRIMDAQVQQKRWKVDTNSRLLSMFLLIYVINLPGGEVRRKTEEDERMMLSYFISAEVQSDGSLSSMVNLDRGFRFSFTLAHRNA